MDPNQVNIKLTGDKKQNIEDAIEDSVNSESPRDVADLFIEFAMG